MKQFFSDNYKEMAINLLHSFVEIIWNNTFCKSVICFISLFITHFQRRKDNIYLVKITSTEILTNTIQNPTKKQIYMSARHKNKC